MCKRTKLRLILFTFSNNGFFYSTRDCDTKYHTQKLGQHILRHVSKFQRSERNN